MDLADHLERLKANDNLKFSQEYEVILYKQFWWMVPIMWGLLHLVN